MAAVRLYALKDELGDKIELQVKAYALIPGDGTIRQAGSHSAQGRMQAGLEGKNDGLEFARWPEDKPVPYSSIPALEAAKCAALQGKAAFKDYDLGLFRAFFQECQDIGDKDVLIALAARAGLDEDRFKQDLDSGSQKDPVMVEFLECLSVFGPYAQGIPLTSFNNSPPLVGCAPMEVYRTGIMRQLEPMAG